MNGGPRYCTGFDVRIRPANGWQLPFRDPRCYSRFSRGGVAARIQRIARSVLAALPKGVSNHMNGTQSEKAARFQGLHGGPGAFVIPNPWDTASARILAGLGFQALATSSAASACAMGRRDGGLTRDEAMAHSRLIVDATDLPVSADLERGFGDAPEIVAETIRLAADAGLVGCTIEDATGSQEGPLYDLPLAVE